jgi:hypothetical protein
MNIVNHFAVQQFTIMNKYIAILIIGAIASLTAVQAGEQCATAKKEAACAAAQKVAATDSCCAADKTAKTASSKSLKTAKKVQATAKGGYRG